MKNRRREVRERSSGFVFADDLIDLDRRVVADLKALAAVVAGLGGIEVTHLAFHAAVALLFFIEDTLLDFHISIIPHLRKKSKRKKKNYENC